MVFGVFDGLHAGHKYFLAAAREYGDKLIAVVAQDDVVRQLKGKTPRQSEEERRLAVAQLSVVIHAVLGDLVSGTYNVIKEHQPDIICLGYDQDALEEDLAEKMRSGAIRPIPIHRLIAYKPDNK